MSDDTVNIEVNGVPLKARKGQMIMQATDPANIYIPRFCYHDKLTIAAVNGYAIQLGLSIVLACDFAVAARSAQLGSATLRMGWQPDEGGHWLLVELQGVLDEIRNLGLVLHH